LRALLDVNVLVALLDAGHLHHRTATDWLAKHARQGWASCPITQNGCIRILSLPAYPNPQSPQAVAARLCAAAADRSHAFVPDSVSLLQAGSVLWDRVLGARQITHAYLLALAVANKARLVSFDRSIPLAAVPAASTRHLVVLGG
jgi:toxin-antitoxin system PIN domain toxin